MLTVLNKIVNRFPFFFAFFSRDTENPLWSRVAGRKKDAFVTLYLGFFLDFLINCAIIQLWNHD